MIYTYNVCNVTVLKLLVAKSNEECVPAYLSTVPISSELPPIIEFQNLKKSGYSDFQEGKKNILFHKNLLLLLVVFSCIYFL